MLLIVYTSEMKKILILSLLLFITIAVAAQQPLDQMKLTQYLSIQKERLGFSGTVLVSKNGKIITSLSTGLASVELGVPITEKNVFPVASISKSFTATLVLLAVAEKKLKLSDSLAQFFPQLRDPAWR
ncbi:MAG: class C beta-lactamase-related serine hydrolase, partial [Pedobacter sp.]